MIENKRIFGRLFQQQGLTFFQNPMGVTRTQKKLVCVVSGSSERLVFSGALDLGF